MSRAPGPRATAGRAARRPRRLDRSAAGARAALCAVVVLAGAGGVDSGGGRRARARTSTPGTLFAEGVTAFRAGDYPTAAQRLEKALADTNAHAGARLAPRRLGKGRWKGPSDPPRDGAGEPGAPAPTRVLNEDWALYLLAESTFYAGGDVAQARAGFERLARMKTSRFATAAAFRAADCAWTAGAHADAAERYRRALPHLAEARAWNGVDVAVARFRVALDAEERHRPEAPRLFQAVYRDFPAHPLATEARRHLPQTPRPEDEEAPAEVSGGGGGGATGGAAATIQGTVQDRLHRAESLTHDRHWDLALAELGQLPADLPRPLAVERDFQIGMTKFQMRRDYGKAAELLLPIVNELSGDKAASALFHGTRALSRIDRDDEAIAGYRQVVARFPRSRFAAEAQFLSGWLDYNRGRFRESLPGLQATLDHFGGSAFADDAGWCVAFAHFLLHELPEARAALDRYARMPPTGMTVDERAARVAYWRARIEAEAGRIDAAKAGYRDVNQRWPFSFFGAAARARLAALGEPTGAAPAARASEEGQRSGAAAAAAAAEKTAAAAAAAARSKIAGDPVLARAAELAAAGLDVEAGWEITRDESGILRRLGDANGARVLLDRYAAYQAFHRAYELAESRGRSALAAAPAGDARAWWEAAYPRAYRELVETYGPPAGNPDLFLYAIMRKESGFSPWDVSYADARGLLQMIPPTSAKVASSLGLDFAPDQLFDPETNVRLGAAYIGSLAKKFGGQIPIVAGSYNAGPKAMAKWCDQHGRHPMDEFVELIAFTQTREYAKRVVGIYARYRYLYGGAPYVLPLAVDAKYAAGGPDY